MTSSQLNGRAPAASQPRSDLESIRKLFADTQEDTLAQLTEVLEKFSKEFEVVTEQVAKLSANVGGASAAYKQTASTVKSMLDEVRADLSRHVVEMLDGIRSDVRSHAFDESSLESKLATALQKIDQSAALSRVENQLRTIEESMAAFVGSHAGAGRHDAELSSAFDSFRIEFAAMREQLTDVLERNNWIGDPSEAVAKQSHVLEEIKQSVAANAASMAQMHPLVEQVSGLASSQRDIAQTLHELSARPQVQPEVVTQLAERVDASSRDRNAAHESLMQRIEQIATSAERAGDHTTVLEHVAKLEASIAALATEHAAQKAALLQQYAELQSAFAQQIADMQSATAQQYAQLSTSIADTIKQTIEHSYASMSEAVVHQSLDAIEHVLEQKTN